MSLKIQTWKPLVRAQRTKWWKVKLKEARRRAVHLSRRIVVASISRCRVPQKCWVLLSEKLKGDLSARRSLPVRGSFRRKG